MRTRKVSISVDAKDLVVLRRIAKQRHHGNLSELFASGVAAMLESERTKKDREARRQRFIEWLGPPPTKEESEAILAVIEGRATKTQRALYDRLDEHDLPGRKSA